MTRSEQARADAMADAETLRAIVAVVEAAEDGDGLRLAEHLGDMARLSLDCPTFAHGYAWLAARAAFRAVPGLRGE